MEICIWSADWGLPSVDFGCLSMIAYAKFSGAPVNIKETNSPFWSPTGRLPVFRHNPAEDLHGSDSQGQQEQSPADHHCDTDQYSPGYWQLQRPRKH